MATRTIKYEAALEMADQAARTMVRCLVTHNEEFKPTREERDVFIHEIDYVEFREKLISLLLKQISEQCQIVPMAEHDIQDSRTMRGRFDFSV